MKDINKQMTYEELKTQMKGRKLYVTTQPGVAFEITKSSFKNEMRIHTDSFTPMDDLRFNVMVGNHVIYLNKIVNIKKPTL